MQDVHRWRARINGRLIGIRTGTAAQSELGQPTWHAGSGSSRATPTPPAGISATRSPGLTPPARPRRGTRCGASTSPLEVPLLRTKAEFETGTPPAGAREAQEAILWAQHLVIVYPLWLGTMPALLKGFLEQTFRPGFAFATDANGPWSKRLKGRSARIVVTMGMPALAYRWYFGAHGLKSLERSILGFCGIRPIRASLFGMVEAADDRKRERWLATMRGHGRRAR
jgi:putative NADPH-quinone reductase